MSTETPALALEVHAKATERDIRNTRCTGLKLAHWTYRLNTVVQFVRRGWFIGGFFAS